MLRIFLYFAVCMLGVHGWNTLYSYTDGKVYLHLSNNDLVSLNFSITGTDKDVEITDNQQVQTLTLPPQNLTLFLVGENLFGVTGDSKGDLSLVEYVQDNWKSYPLNLSELNDASFYNNPTVLSDPNENQTVYVYGGEGHDTVSSRMVSIEMSTLKVSNISTATTPQPFSGAANVLAPNPQNQLVIGGQSDAGVWLNMYQLATWNSDSGWSFQQIGKLDTQVNLRKFALALPIFSALDSATPQDISANLQISEVVVLGGEIAGHASTPEYTRLWLGSNDWHWNSSTNMSGLNLDQVLGAATIFNSLVVVNSSTEQDGDSLDKRDNLKGLLDKRDTQYKVNLYDVHSLDRVTTLTKNYEQIKSSSSASSSYRHAVQKKAIIGTVVPVCSLIILAIGGSLLYRKHKKKQQEQRHLEEMRDIEYRFASYKPAANPFEHTNLDDDSHHRKPSMSTLGGQSFDSWAKKRTEFERGNTIRQSYIALNETLTDEGSEQNAEETAKPDNTIERGTHILKKSFSFSNSPEYTTLAKKHENVFDDLHDLAEGASINSDKSSLDDKFDVQVLVSSKRRSVLRVVNPDLGTITDEDEGEERTKSKFGKKYTGLPMNEPGVRQRTPSGMKFLEE